MTQEQDIVLERGPYWVLRIENGFEIYRISTSGTHSVRCASIGFQGEKGMAYVLRELERRLNKGD